MVASNALIGGGNISLLIGFILNSVPLSRLLPEKARAHAWAHPHASSRTANATIIVHRCVESNQGRTSPLQGSTAHAQASASASVTGRENATAWMLTDASA